MSLQVTTDDYYYCCIYAFCCGTLPADGLEQRVHLN